MLSYTTGRNLAGIWTKNTASAHLTYIDSVANADYKRICAFMDWPFLERNRSITTTASTQFTTLPYDCELVREISVVPSGSTTRYTPREITSRAEWDRLNLSSSVTSDIPEYFFVLNGQVGLWPTPVSANTIYVQQKTRAIDLGVADITSTTITTATNGSATVVVSGGLTALHAGMWMRITYVPASTNTGDGVWYEISGVSGTTVTLVRKYGGTSIAAGTAACTVSQLPLLPESFQDMPWLWAAGDYWSKEDDKRAKRFFDEHGHVAMGNLPATGKVKELIAAYGSASTNMVLDEGYEDEIINPNLTIRI